MIASKILSSLKESGKVSDLDVLVCLHNSGIVDIETLLAESLANFKDRIIGASIAEKRIALEELSGYIELYKALIDDDPVNEQVDPVDEIEEDVVTYSTPEMAVRA